MNASAILLFQGAHKNIVVYLDNGICAAKRFSKGEEHLLLVRSTKYKCHWLPIKVICWLGINWDFKNNCMFIPPEKISQIFFSRTGAFLQGSLLVLPGEFTPIFLSWVMLASS